MYFCHLEESFISSPKNAGYESNDAEMITSTIVYAAWWSFVELLFRYQPFYVIFTYWQTLNRSEIQWLEPR